MTGWEYLLVKIQGTEDITGLTRLGEDGWEGFAAIPIVERSMTAGSMTTGSIVFLKRQRS